VLHLGKPYCIRRYTAPKQKGFTAK
jgi:hypothetical protein